MSKKNLDLKFISNDNSFFVDTQKTKQSGNGELIQVANSDVGIPTERMEVIGDEYTEVEVTNTSTIDLTKAANDNTNSGPDAPGGGALGIKFDIKETDKNFKNLPCSFVSESWGGKTKVFTQTSINKAIVLYGLTDVVKNVPPSYYKMRDEKNVRLSIQQLLCALALKPILKAIPKRMGAHPGKGLPSKTELLKYLYGFGRYEIELIESLDKKWAKKAIKWALKKNRPITLHTTVTLKDKYKENYKKCKKRNAAEAKNKFYATLVETPQKADTSSLYNGAIIDLTQVPGNFDLTEMTLPLTENALVLVAVMPKELHKALDLIKGLGLKYVDNVVWQRNKVKAGYVWSVNTHTNILVTIKGCLNKPIDYTRLQSISFDAQTEGNKHLPDYYYSSLEALILGGTYLEVFSTRQYNDQWFSYQAQGGQNV